MVYFLRVVLAIQKTTGLDYLETMIFVAIFTANTTHFDPPASKASRYADLGDAPPESERRPVSILGLAHSLGLPYETTRRYVNKLIDAGVVKKAPRGVIVPGTGGRNKAMNDLRVENLANLRRLFSDLERAGVDLRRG